MQRKIVILGLILAVKETVSMEAVFFDAARIVVQKRGVNFLTENKIQSFGDAKGLNEALSRKISACLELGYFHINDK